MLSKPGNAIIDMIKRIVALPGDRCQIKDSKIALKARLSALKALSDEQGTTIQALRAEVA